MLPLPVIPTEADATTIAVGTAKPEDERLLGHPRPRR